jgi:hypothetical protein
MMMYIYICFCVCDCMVVLDHFQTHGRVLKDGIVRLTGPLGRDCVFNGTSIKRDCVFEVSRKRLRVSRNF